MNHPRLGERVYYTLTKNDAAEINGDRAEDPRREGHTASEGRQYPAILVGHQFDSTWNLQVHLDGNDLYWATSGAEGQGPGTWQTRVTL